MDVLNFAYAKRALKKLFKLNDTYRSLGEQLGDDDARLRSFLDGGVIATVKVENELALCGCASSGIVPHNVACIHLDIFAYDKHGEIMDLVLYPYSAESSEFGDALKKVADALLQ